ncbi:MULTISPECIES: argininosuccinate lyase [Prochlorococcus]|uniref:Argininosuccinate lyase n=1 Tax=Prochlorococcus marinus (strain SARG / CCMP1375 / SS120) TaxID=167539 RepID=ARLY_PROMA|nr:MULTISPECIES: argininosuccinate lyase [Prochlorococcus]Q7VEK0.1 RecName: Full=Argininosuccinate lyase; Short=ASAL; AltName: Full=Arginosuccinase [Prochlorococcus marinus subsp. marinus str. CCMP1375]AAP99058.1 Argininosuccinate lyase [Prochlorococcus marinus subsp. marinus str. CCMP1375]KGG14408.1 Argininosuccinate lyase [Prochlorococcus marinus str. LG]
MQKTWSDRFEEGLNPFIESFNASINFDFLLIEEDLDGSIAHARMLAKTGIITSEEADQLEAALQKIRLEASQGLFKPDISDEDVHMSVERRLISILGPLGKKLHTARSRNDQVGTDLRLWLRRRIDDIDIELKKLQVALFKKAEKNLLTLIPGYTHLQRAQPLSLAHHLLAYIEMLQRDRNRLADVRERVNICPLGAAALAGTSLPIDRAFTANQLGFTSIYSNSLDAVSDRDFTVEFTAAASLIMTHISRLADEIILWASEEFSFVRLTDRCSTGSSLMPQKKNPDVPELVRGKTGRVFGHLQSLLTMMKGLPLAYNKDFQEDKEAVFDTVKTVRDSLKAMTILLEEGLEFSLERLKETVEADFSNATDVADYLVSKNIPFREAYQIVGRVVRLCIQKKILLKDLTLKEWQEINTLIDHDIYEKITPEKVVAARISDGGTGFDRVREELEKWRNDLISLNQ